MSINLLIILITGVVSFMTFKNESLLNKLIFWPHKMKQNVVENYRFITHGFIHADVMHLLFNMITLYFFGEALEHVLGSYHYLLFYLLALIIASVGTYMKYNNHYQYRSLGASGAVAAVLFANIYLDPWNSLYLFGAIPVPAILFAVFYLLYSYRMGRSQGDNINHNAHLLGSIFGLIYMLVIVDPTHGTYFLQKLSNFNF